MFNFHGAAHRSDKSCESLFLFVVHTFLFCSFLDYSLRGHFTHRYKTILKLLLANVDIWGPIRLLFRNSEGFSAAFSAAFLACNLECPAENPSQHETQQSNRIGPPAFWFDGKAARIRPRFTEPNNWIGGNNKTHRKFLFQPQHFRCVTCTISFLLDSVAFFLARVSYKLHTCTLSIFYKRHREILNSCVS